MDGAELLSQVREKYPATIRIALSGYSDSEMILESVKATHLFLSKPADQETIKRTIDKAMSLKMLLHNEKIDELVSRIKTPPSLPSVYEEITAELASPDCSITNIGDIIGRDIAMSAKVLQLVNSAFFGLARQVESPVEAANYLGLDTVRSLTLSIKVFESFQAEGTDSKQIDALWSHSQYTASCAKAIAKHLALSEALANTAYTGGLLHDIGRLLLLNYFADDYVKVTQSMEIYEMDARSCEQQVFGVSHELVGSYLLSLWGLPNKVVECVAYHHDPAHLDFSAIGPPEIVYAAQFIAHDIAEGTDTARVMVEEGLIDGAMLNGWIGACEDLEAA
jgi:putative nucleotidyltransferase with HDIG domain